MTQPKIQLDEAALACLQPGECLSGTIIEAFLIEIERRNNVMTPFPKLSVLDTYFMYDVLNRRPELASKRFKRFDPFSRDIVLVPLHSPGQPGHWSLLSVFPQLKTIESYDSLWMSHREQLYALYEFLKTYALGSGREFDGSQWHLKDSSRKVPKQTTPTDCGVYVCWFADRLADGKNIEDGRNVVFCPTKYREYIRFELMDPPMPEFKATTSSDPLISASLPSPTTSDPWDLLVADVMQLSCSDQHDPQPSVPPSESPYLSIQYDPDEFLSMLDEAAKDVETPVETPLTQVEPALSITLNPEEFEEMMEEAIEEEAQVVTPPVQPPTVEPENKPTGSGNYPRSGFVRKKKEKKRKIFFPGLGWKRVKDRFLRPDLRW